MEAILGPNHAFVNGKAAQALLEHLGMYITKVRFRHPPLSLTFDGAIAHILCLGKRYKEAFIASPDKRFIFLKSKGARSKKNPVGTYETSKEIPKNSKKEWYLQWQPDHVCDLGIFTQLARLDTPKGIKEAAWTEVQDGIFGETPSVCLRLSNSKGNANAETSIERREPERKRQHQNSRPVAE